MTYANFMTQMTGVVALGLTTTLGMGEALAQNPSHPTSLSRTDVYAPPSPTSSVYHPAPTRPYVMTSVPANGRPYDGPVISERTPWWQEKEGRYAIFGGFCLFMLGLAGSVFWTIHNHFKNGGE
jgi:hypothetical protein